MVPWTGRGPGRAPGSENPSPGSSSRDEREFHPTPNATRRCPAFNGSEGTRLWWFPLGQHGRTFPQEMDRGLQELDGNLLHTTALPRNRPHASCQRWPHQPHCAPASVETQVARLNTCAPARTLSGHGERSPEPARPGEGGQCAAPCGTEGRTWGPVNGHSSRRSPGKRR